MRQARVDTVRRFVAAAMFAMSASCSAPTSAPPLATDNTVLAHLAMSGSPESSAGASWTYRDTVDGVVYDLSGVLLKPVGTGPFPAVIVSHGYGGNAAGYSRTLGATMSRWGAVVIATNYTHAGNVAAGAPGGPAELGASATNVLRARRAIEILRALGYVDMGRVAAHGHSMGAFVTTALAATYPRTLRVASHTAGGVRLDGPTAAAPTEAQGRAIRTPYQMHHGDIDQVVALAADQRLSALLGETGTAHELFVYAGAGHNEVPFDPVVLERVRAWYAKHGLF
ncbi:MAG: dienelactone hydrolase family protein [Gemmatimonadaceae bacterium]